jgi:hypothetical protein
MRYRANLPVHSRAASLRPPAVLRAQPKADLFVHMEVSPAATSPVWPRRIGTSTAPPPVRSPSRPAPHISPHRIPSLPTSLLALPRLPSPPTCTIWS